MAGLEDLCTVTDTLLLARAKHPGQRNSLDALCQRYQVDNSQRDLHGALLDAEILADVYLAMTGGQTALQLSESGNDNDGHARAEQIIRLPASRATLPVIMATAEELAAHEAQLQAIAAASGGRVVWRGITNGEMAPMFRPDNKPPESSDDELHIVFQGGQMLSDMRSRTGCLIAREQVLQGGWTELRRQFLGYWRRSTLLCSGNRHA